MLSGFITSLIRTGSGYAVAWLLSLKIAGPVLSATGVDSDTAKERMTALLVFVLGTVYYFVVRALEERWPQLGFLIGIPSKPSYGDVEDSGDGTVPAIEPAAATPADPEQPAAGVPPAPAASDPQQTGA